MKKTKYAYVLVTAFFLFAGCGGDAHRADGDGADPREEAVAARAAETPPVPAKLQPLALPGLGR